jgi:hypothetical protein
MRSRSCWFLVLALVLGLASQKLNAGDDFKPLFNGKNLDGWKTKKGGEPLDGKTEAYQGRFKVVEGKLVIDPTVKGDSYIETAKEFKDVHIKLEFKPGEKCNNDLFLRGLKFDIVLGKIKGVKDGWNELEIIAKDNKADVKINGESQKTYDLKAPSSPFSIRAEYGVLEIRNLRAKE